MVPENWKLYFIEKAECLCYTMIGLHLAGIRQDINWLYYSTT